MTGTDIRDWVRDSPSTGSRYAIPCGASVSFTLRLRGVWTAGDDGLYYICRTCLGRLMARGVRLPAQEQVWQDQPSPIGVCAGCE